MSGEKNTILYDGTNPWKLNVKCHLCYLPFYDQLINNFRTEFKSIKCFMTLVEILFQFHTALSLTERIHCTFLLQIAHFRKQSCHQTKYMFTIIE